MEHTNLFLYEDKASLDAKYPASKVDDVVPGVAYGRADVPGDFDYKVIYNKKKVTYDITVHSKDDGGYSVADDYIVRTHEALEGYAARAVINPVAVPGYEPTVSFKKMEVEGDAETDIIYVRTAATIYTVTVNHIFNGEPIAAPTTVQAGASYEGEVVSVTVEPLTLPGYTAEPVTLEISGDTSYSLTYGPNYEWVDLGLPSGTLWASMNVGATRPEEYGFYFGWGEVDSSKTTDESVYNWNNYKWGTENNLTKYNTDDGLDTLLPEDDAAYVIWGNGWRIPSEEQVIELVENTISSWTTDYEGTGVAGLRLESMTNGNTIFFPAAGGIFSGGHEQQGATVAVWTSTLSKTDVRQARDMNAKSSGWTTRGDDYGVRRFGLSVRGVKNPS